MNLRPSSIVLIPALLFGAPAAGQLSINNSTPGTWMDISGTGTPLSLADDGEVDIFTTVGNALLAAGTVRVGANGAVRFAGSGLALDYTNDPIPSGDAFSGNQTLMPFWDDIDIDNGNAGEIYWQEIAGTLVIQWQNAEFFPGGGDTTTFQLQVHSAGPSLAQFLYQDVLQPRADGGGSATIGYQHGLCPTGNVQWSFDTSNAVIDGDVLSLVGTPPPPPPNTIVIVDTMPGTWMDISGTGTPLSLCDDCEVDIATTVGNALLAAGTVRVGSNGGVRFDGTGLELGYVNGTIPSTAAFSGDQTLFPFWDDFDTNGGVEGEIYWQEIGGTLVIQWQDTAFYPGGGDRATFQLQVHSGGPALAQFLYQDIMQPRANGGESATIGYQGRMCVDTNFQWSFDTAGSVADGDVLSILFGGSVGTNYCISVPNSTGSASTISATGSDSISANDLVLSADNLPAQPGIFIAGPTQAQLPFYNGFLCIDLNGLQRFATIANPVGGVITEAVDYATSAPGGLNVVAGSSFNYQRWNRDPAGGGTNANFSDAVEIVHTP